MIGKHDQGFTLVEVMVALIIVAVVSTPLFHMFVTTSYVNKDAQVIDRANVIAVQQSEKFKADPGNYKDKYGDYCFYKGDGTFISSAPDLTAIPTEAYYMVESNLVGPTVVETDAEGGYYPGFAGTIDLSQYDSDSGDTLDIEVTIKNNDINNNYMDINVKSNASEESFPSLDSSKIKNNQIPIRVDYGGRPVNITLVNKSNFEAEFYIFNADDESNVKLITQKGTSSIAYVKPDTSSYKEYDLTLIVNKLNKGTWEQILTYSAKKYL